MSKPTPPPTKLAQASAAPTRAADMAATEEAHWKRAGTRRLISSLAIAWSVTLVVLLAWHFNLFARMRLGMNNVLFVPRATTDKIVIVAADDQSHADYGRALVSWPRDLHAQLITILSDAGARVVAFDILFAEEAEGDDAVSAAIDYARTATAARTRVVMPVAGTQSQDTPDTPYAADFAYVLLPNDTLRAAGPALGHTNSVLDTDGTLRHQLTRVTVQDQTYLSFSIVTYLSYLRIPPAAFDQLVTLGDHELIVSERRIPIDDEGRMVINYFTAPGEQVFPVYSYRDVLNGEVDPAVFDDKIVLVGLYNHTGLLDSYTVPISLGGHTMSGVEIHANMIEQYLQNEMLTPQSQLSQALVIIVLGLLASLIYGWTIRRWWLFIPLIPALFVAWIAVAFLIFNTQRIVVELFYPSVALLLPAALTAVVQITVETQRRRRAELLLSSIVTASSQRLSLDHTLAAIAEDLRTISKAESVTIWLWDAQRRKLERALPPASDLSQPLLPQERAFAESQLKQPRVTRTGNQITIPLAWQNEPLGIMVVGPARRLSVATRRILQLFGWQTSSVIANLLQYQQTQQLSDLKTRMIRMASHDLKNPLSTVLGYTELMRDHAVIGQPYTDIYARFVEMIHSAGDTMLAIVDEILSMERTRSGNLRPDAFDMLELLDRLLPGNRAALEQKNQTLIVELPATFPPMYGDVHQLREAINNLLSNAHKYTPENGNITLRLSQRDDYARIEVQDTGYGIAKAAQEKLFQEFYRVRTEKTLEISGTGLGLSLVKAIVDAHLGQVWVESEENEGSTFIIELPLQPDL